VLEQEVACPGGRELAADAEGCASARAGARRRGLADRGPRGRRSRSPPRRSRWPAFSPAARAPRPRPADR
jgi:hypothetical protein